MYLLSIADTVTSTTHLFNVLLRTFHNFPIKYLFVCIGITLISHREQEQQPPHAHQQMILTPIAGTHTATDITT